MFHVSRVLRSKHASVDALVVGAGPSGIAVVGHLLHHLPGGSGQLWADPTFSAGRVHRCYREVPSNTKVELFAQFATSTAPLRRIVEHAEAPNALTELGELPQDQGCELSRAADMCLMLSDGLERHFGQQCRRHQGKVVAASLDKSTNLWNVSLDNGTNTATPRLVLCTGSSPKEQEISITRGKTRLHLDTALQPSKLAQTIAPGEMTTVAVIGASHSAVLVLMNLYQLASTTHPNLRVKWFTRHKDLRYAKYMDGWILYDNTGLKGQAAQWARQHLEEDALALSPVSRVVSKIWTPAEEQETMYDAHMPGCSHVVEAIGYQRDPVPRLTTVDGPGAAPEPLSLEHDGLTGRFFSRNKATNPYVPGLFGAGIAFPERVTDPAGNVEHAVGFWKFVKFCQRVVPQWADSPVQPR
ncbi:hypothetical protein ESCO_004577 [Escovopsis weberi]|uniref:Uncharacterized protein n=1 Tax=Escovopsis weberi TaxID=150374 RepID=A0A0M8N0T4_ESCWE|nr:hypothetical protein ESCO_004577 [Escovopsis weberi]